MAVASLASVMVGMSASAATGTGDVTTNGGKTVGSASCSVTDTFVWVNTTSSIGTCRVITAKVSATSGATISGDTEHSEYGATSSSITCYVKGVTSASSYHYLSSDSYVGTGSLYVNR